MLDLFFSLNKKPLGSNRYPDDAWDKVRAKIDDVLADTKDVVKENASLLCVVMNADYEQELVECYTADGKGSWETRVVLDRTPRFNPTQQAADELDIELLPTLESEI